jgi:hypothetical protein
MASKRKHLPQGDTPGKPINKRNSNEEVPSFEELIKQCNCFIEELSSITSVPQNSTKGLQSLKKRLLKYLHDLYLKKRSAASHLLVFMIADELRNSKPYAIPVRFLPYKSITDSKVRELETEMENAMTSLEMTVVGMY